MKSSGSPSEKGAQRSVIHFTFDVPGDKRSRGVNKCARARDREFRIRALIVTLLHPHPPARLAYFSSERTPAPPPSPVPHLAIPRRKPRAIVRLAPPSPPLPIVPRADDSSVFASTHSRARENARIIVHSSARYRARSSPPFYRRRDGEEERREGGGRGRARVPVRAGNLVESGRDETRGPDENFQRRKCPAGGRGGGGRVAERVLTGTEMYPAR